MLTEDKLCQTLVHDQLAEPSELQLDILRQLQVFLPRNEKLDELAGQDLLDLLGCVLSCSAFVQMVGRLTDDSRLHADRMILK